ncbi:MAG TPA: NADH-quinone oxidoreductase subunit M [Chitinophagaceae bacterium]|nr:NADH-quinone oxidoreductase subunit M [Chitinophagaceae bacterium]
MISLLLISIPLLSGLVLFVVKDGGTARRTSLFSALLTLVALAAGMTMNQPELISYRTEWMPGLGSSFSLRLDGMGQLLCLLTALAFPLAFISTWRADYTKANNFFALMLLAQAGLMGVFLAADALLFYFFWELALIPMYFICSQWGGERRIAVTFKFFIYTFVGSVLMLIAILSLYAKTPDRSFDLESFYRIVIGSREQGWHFWLFFLAFAIKMPVFPFHTWQPDTYEQSPTAATMILSAVMVKMGVFGILRWLLPVLPVASYQWGDVVMSLAVVGIVYASLIAIRQDDLKRFVAYSSIAHVGLMAAAIFAENRSGMQGVMIQMFNHGINIIGLWMVVEMVERRYGTRKISELGGLARRAPVLATLLVIIALANIALPLTSGFPGEFLMINGLLNSEATQYRIWFTVFAASGIVLAAVYTLNMIRKVFYGDTTPRTEAAVDISRNEKAALWVVVAFVLAAGVYPQALLNVTNEISEFIWNKANVLPLLKK